MKEITGMSLSNIMEHGEVGDVFEITDSPHWYEFGLKVEYTQAGIKWLKRGTYLTLTALNMGLKFKKVGGYVEIDNAELSYLADAGCKTVDLFIIGSDGKYFRINKHTDLTAYGITTLYQMLNTKIFREVIE